MREILFRGKRKDNGEWVEGDSLVHSMYKKGDVCIGVVEGLEIHSVIPDTVGQYTGLTDKNGVKIFEGDILKLGGDDLPHWLKEGDLRLVKFENGGFDPLCDYDSDCGTAVIARLCEIIGNIYDNNELLEGKEA